MKDTILFDLGGTLVRYYAREEFPPILGKCIRQVQDYLREQGLLRLEPEAITERVCCEDHEDPSLRVRPLADRLVRIFDIDDTLQPPELIQEMCRRFMPPIFATAKVYDDTVGVLRDLRAEGFKTALVSNSPWGSPADLWRQEIRRLGLAELFDVQVFCGDVGWRKPAREIFDFTLRALGTRAEQCLFVGDHPRWDISGARSAGIEAVLIDRTEAEHPPADSAIRGLRGLWTKLRLNDDGNGE